MSLNRRRLLKEYASLQSSPPPDFFLPTPAPASDDLTTITLHLIGPASTPFEAGLFTVVLKLPPTYPVQPPRATFRTKIFHPNVCDRTGDVCVDTLKREWNEKVTLYEVCVVIRCLLVEPNPTSSLNEEAGRLLAAEYAAWERRARLMTKVHAGIPPELEETVREVRRRDAGEDEAAEKEKGVQEKTGQNKKEEKEVEAEVASGSGSTGVVSAAVTKRKIASAVGTSGKKQKEKANGQQHKRSESQNNNANIPLQTESPRKEKDINEKDSEKDSEKEKDENEKEVNDSDNDSFGKENAKAGQLQLGGGTPGGITPAASTTASQSGASTIGATGTAAKQLPQTTTSKTAMSTKPASLLGKRSSEESLVNDRTGHGAPSGTGEKQAANNGAEATKVKVFGSSTASGSGSGTNKAPQTLKKKVLGSSTSAVTTSGKAVAGGARKGLKRF